MYPEAKMLPAMKIWKLPAGKEAMLSEVCTNGEYFLQEKIDGFWYMYEKTENYSYLFSRTKSKVTGYLSEKSANVPHIMSALDAAMPPRTTLIGEIYYPGKTSKDTTTIMVCSSAKAVKRQKNNPIHYYVHDIIEYNGESLVSKGAEERYDFLAKIWEEANLECEFLTLAKKVTENLEEEISRILAAGREGVVLKKKDYPYTPNKRPAWSTVKVKQMDSVDLVCMGFCPPTKEYTGKDIEIWPYWERVAYCQEGNEYGLAEGLFYGKSDDNCDYKPVTKFYFFGWNTAIEIGAYDEQGNLVKLGTVSSGLTDDDKRLMTERPQNYLNKVVSLDCMSLNKKDKTLRHPVFKSWRDDKNPEDCKIEEIFR